MHAHTVGGAAAASKRLVALALAVAGAVAVVLTATAPAAGARGGRRAHTGTAPALARLLSRRVDQHVIVLLKAQFAPALAGSRASLERADEIRAEQLPLIDQLRATHATHVKLFTLVDSLAATVSRAERARLAADPEVARVLPDSTISLGAAPASSSLAFRADDATTSASSPPLNTIPGACSSNASAPLLDPEGLALTGVDSDDSAQPTARSLGITGAGVKVAWIADGIDTNNQNFIRPDGTSVFSSANGGDYQDFSGDGPGQPTSGDEAVLDANTIAGQGLIPYNVQDFGAEPDPTPCWIRIEGVAPGVGLVGLDVFGNNEDTTTSNFLEAINYAVETDRVDVINESFGSNNFPDVTALDVTKQFNDAAVAAGVFVSVSSGDAGPFNTIGSPSTDPLVMSVGASTDFRFYAQTNYAGTRYFASTGWYDNQISSLSSSGFDETGQTVNLVAPGDLSFASCDASAVFAGCVNFLGQPSDVEESGGTSESSPFIAGAAALVIQAYRQTHSGATPSPALIKQILISSATDIGAPAQEQGAGLLNAYKAVELAESIPGGGVTPTPVGNSLLVSSEQLNATGDPGQTKRFQVTVTNTAASSQTVALSTRTFGSEYDIQAGTTQLLDGTNPEFENWAGVEANYSVIHFTVPSGANRLVGSVAWPVNSTYCVSEYCDGDLNSRVRMILIDPSGALAAHSLPQGSGSYGTVEVNSPPAGTWEAVIYGDVAADGGTNGTVHWQVGVENSEPFGQLSTGTLVLPAGQSQTFSLAVQEPASAGDAAGSVLLDAGNAGTTSIPVTLRSLIDMNTGGTFSGTLTGGNGRPDGEGQEEYYEFDVPSGVSDITANLRFVNDPQDPVAEYLVNPDGDTLGYGQNSAVTAAGTTYSTGLSAYTLNPTPGRWTLIVVFGEPTVGNELAQPYSGQLVFDAVRVRGLLIPDNDNLPLTAGKSLTVPVRITNTGASRADYFIDPRLSQYEDLTLAPGTLSVSLPMTAGFPYWVVPTETSSVEVASTSSVPAMFDFEPVTGDPDLASSSPGAGPLCADTALANYTAANARVTAGVWIAGPTECGPYAAPATPATDSIAMTAETREFDPAVTSSTGDGWLSAVSSGGTFTPLVLAPGQTGVAKVTFTPTGSPGALVTGDLFVDTLEDDVPPPAYGQSTGDELAAIPYAYRVAGG